MAKNFTRYSTEEIEKFHTEAHNELIENFYEWKINDLMDWWQKWYMKIGHRRLGRMLVQLERETREK